MRAKIVGADAKRNKESVTGVARMVSAVERIGLEMDVMELLEELFIDAYEVHQVREHSHMTSDTLPADLFGGSACFMK